MESLTGFMPAIGAFGVIAMGFIIFLILNSRRLESSSLFNRLFIVVAVTSAFFSAVSSAIGFGLITSQESEDIFRNLVLPPAFGVFVFFVAVAIWVGGAELVRHRDWFRGLDKQSGGLAILADGLFFLERSVKIFFLIPLLALILFFISTWTSVVGIAGVDAVRYTYSSELARLQEECTGVVRFRLADLLFVDDLSIAIADVKRAARREAETGGQTGIRGRGATSDYIDGVAEWLGTLEKSARAIVNERQGDSDLNPYDPSVCSQQIDGMKLLLNSNAFENYDRWAREFENQFDGFAQTLNRWRLDRRLLLLMQQQLDNFDRANPKPLLSTGPSGAIQQQVIDRYADEVTNALNRLTRRQSSRKPSVPIPSAAELSPARGLDIFREILDPPPPVDIEASRPPRRTQAVVEAERIPGLSIITPRDGVLKNFQIFSDVWALAIAWDYASYLLMLVFLFFPSAERAPAHKD